MHIGLEERHEIGSCLGDDEVIAVEELGDAGEGRVARSGVGGAGPGGKGGRSICVPRLDSSSGGLAEEGWGLTVHRWCGSIRGNGRGANELMLY